jgi:hypothetical protein
VQSLDGEELEHMVLTAHVAERRWLKVRTQELHLAGTPDGNHDIIYLDFLLDRVILCVYSSGDIVIWNTQRNHEVKIEPSSSWELWDGDPWTSAIAVPDIKKDALYVVVTRSQNRYNLFLSYCKNY